MTQEGETEGYTASDHIRALFNHSCPGLFDLCLVNDAPIPPSVMRGYTREGAEPILCDRDACEALGVEVITRPVSTVENGLVRHNPGHLAWELVRLHAQRNIPSGGGFPPPDAEKPSGEMRKVCSHLRER